MQRLRFNTFKPLKNKGLTIRSGLLLAFQPGKGVVQQAMQFRRVLLP